MIHEDGEVSFFNDCAFGIAMPPYEIFSYAKELELNLNLQTNSLITNIHSGHSRIVQLYNATVTTMNISD